MAQNHRTRAGNGRTDYPIEKRNRTGPRPSTRKCADFDWLCPGPENANVRPGNRGWLRARHPGKLRQQFILAPQSARMEQAKGGFHETPL